MSKDWQYEVGKPDTRFSPSAGWTPRDYMEYYTKLQQDPQQEPQQEPRQQYHPIPSKMAGGPEIIVNGPPIIRDKTYHSRSRRKAS